MTGSRRRPRRTVRSTSVIRGAIALVLATVLTACDVGLGPGDGTGRSGVSVDPNVAAPSAPASGDEGARPSTAGSNAGPATAVGSTGPAPGADGADTPTGTSSPAPVGSSVAGEPAPIPGQPASFGFAAKHLRGEVMAFVTTSQVDDALARLDLSTVSTIAFFSLEASAAGGIGHDGRWRTWTSRPVDELIARAHAAGTRVVISLARFSWTSAQTATSTKLLASAAARARLAREVAAEVVRRGVDGVNVDFEPIPRGQQANFTDLVRQIRRELDARRRGYQLTFDVVGHFESYDVRAALQPGAADAVYLMGYHFAGTFSTVAHATAPLGGPRYSVADAIRLLRRVARPDQIIVGVPYYGHVWPTATGALNARTTGGGGDVTYERARAIARTHPTTYDVTEQVRRVAWRARDCGICLLHWVQLYFDDARSLTAKWQEFQRQGLLGTGIWTTAFEGASGDLTTALRAAWAVAP